MTDHTELRAQLASAQGHLAALEAYQNAHGVKPPLLDQQRAAVATLTAATAAHHRKDTRMPNYDLVRENLAKVTAELRDLHRSAGDRALSPAQQARWDELTADAEIMEQALSQGAQDEARQATRTAQLRKWGAAPMVGGSTPTDLAPGDVARLSATEARDTALAMLDRSADHLDDAAKTHVEKLLRSESTPSRDPGALARHIVLTSGEEYRAAFRKVTARFPSSIVPMPEREANALAIVQRASMAEGAGGTGGFAVPAFLDPTIVLNAQGSANPIRRLARNETITTKTWKGVSTEGVTWEFVAEGQASSDASPTVSQPSVDVHTARAWITYSIELEQDAVELDAQLMRLLGNGWEETVAGVLATGSGSGAPKGIITALDAIAASEVQIAAPGALAAGDIAKAWVGLPDRARDNAAWVMSESVRETVAGWGDAFGNRTVDLGGRLTKLRDRPVYSTDKFPAIATTTGSANQMVVGDFSGYLIVQRAGMTVEPVQTVFNGDGFPIGQRGLFAYARIGADVVDPTVLRLLQQ